MSYQRFGVIGQTPGYGAPSGPAAPRINAQFNGGYRDVGYPAATPFGAPFLPRPYIPSSEENERDTLNQRGQFNEEMHRQRARTTAERGGAVIPPPMPTYIMGGSSRAPTMIPPGAGISAPFGMGPTMKAPAGHVVTDPEQFVKNPAYHEGSPTTQPSIENQHPVPEYVKVRGGSHVDYAPGFAPTTQPSQQPAQQGNVMPLYPGASYGTVNRSNIDHMPGNSGPTLNNIVSTDTPQQSPMQQMSGGPGGVVYNQNGIPSDAGNYARNRAYSDTHHGTGQIQLTEQQARAMWGHVATRIPDPNQAADEFHQMLQKYGVDGHALLGSWAKGGTLNQYEQQLPPKVTQGIPLPLSMLGPSNGLDPGTRYGTPNMSQPGPTISPLPNIQPGGTAPFPGSTPLLPQYAMQQQTQPPAPPQGGPSFAQRFDNPNVGYASSSDLNLGTQPAAQPQASARKPSQGARPTTKAVTSQQEYDALPDGAKFTWNGQTLTKGG